MSKQKTSRLRTHKRNEETDLELRAAHLGRGVGVGEHRNERVAFTVTHIARINLPRVCRCRRIERRGARRGVRLARIDGARMQGFQGSDLRGVRCCARRSLARVGRVRLRHSTPRIVLECLTQRMDGGGVRHRFLFSAPLLRRLLRRELCLKGGGKALVRGLGRCGAEARGVKGGDAVE